MTRPLNRCWCTYVIPALAAIFLSTNVATAQSQDGQPTATPEELRATTSERLVIAGRQRMLVEAMAADLCFAVSDVAFERSMELLHNNWSTFKQYHRDMVKKEDHLELSSESKERVVNAWVEVDRSWNELSKLYEPAFSGTLPDAASFDRAIALTDIVAEQSTTVLAALRAAYSKHLGASGFGDALLIDLYERQRMLAERISKNVCLIAWGDFNDDRLAELSRTIEIFDASLDAFQDGMSELGVPPPPTAAIAKNLAAARSDWQPVAAFAFGVASGMGMDEEGLVEFADSMTMFNTHMTAALNELVEHHNAPGG